MQGQTVHKPATERERDADRQQTKDKQTGKHANIQTEQLRAIKNERDSIEKVTFDIRRLKTSQYTKICC